ncbi:dopamine N-acetyltransferase isoform X1 [Aphis craccivora]|uniref:aralkylamine N-acetyltransferase n=1 Tax=Aphis craccivora TaxID=307492 RepID=A0A6G0YPQ3_APHCR|nr:dopamine N-acetyltransferase isoform X1 [Aphis craccivora]
MASSIKIDNGFAIKLSSNQLFQKKIYYSNIMDEANEAKFSYSIVPITAKDKHTVAAFLRKFFFRDEPLNVAIQLLEETDSAAKLENYCISYLQYGMTFMAVSQTGDIMGVILNNIMHRDDEEEDEEDDETCNENLKFKDIVVLLDKIKREADVFAQYKNVNRILEIKIVTVNEAYRGQGVCKALIDKTKEYALEMGCQMIYVECTSHYSAKAVERLGFQCIYSLAYNDYVNEHGEMVFKTQSPHRGAKVFVLPL